MTSVLGASRARSVWMPIWVVTMLLIFEPDLRSIGLSQRALPISAGLIQGFWLSDLGLLLPIIAVFLGGRGGRLFRGKMMRCVIGIGLYGAAIAVLRGNQFSPFAYDLRICLALITGLSLVECSPKRPGQLADVLVVICGVGTFLSCIVLLEMPKWGTAVVGGERVTAESTFLLIGAPMVLLAPTIILTTVEGLSRLTLLSWITAAVLLMEVVILLQTRSLAVSIVLSLALARAATVAVVRGKSLIARALRQRPVIGRGTSLALAILSVGVLVDRSEALLAFLDRMASGIHLANDTTWLIRAAEVVDVFGSMGLVEHLTGMGLGPTPPVNMFGVPVFALHVGVLNVWWRFGVIGFLLLLWSMLRVTKLWLRARRRLLEGTVQSAKDVAMIVVGPGVIALAAQAFISGGWAITSMLALGIAWGIYRSLAETGSFEDTKRSRLRVGDGQGARIAGSIA